MYDEIIDRLDDNGLVIGQVSRSEFFDTGSPNFRLASAMFRTAAGDFILLRRAYTKKAFPGLFGTVGGCVKAGETYQEAFVREVYEEIGLDVYKYSWRFVGYANPKQDNTIGHVGFFEVICDDIIAYNKDDFAEMRQFTFAELQVLCQQNREITHNTPLLFKKFYCEKLCNLI